MIRAQGLSKSYKVADKQPGLAGTVRHFFRRRYRTIEAVKQVSFSIEPGETVGFLGANGAGKTTALKMLTGLIYPTSGVVEVAGHTPFRRQTPFLKQITLVMGQKQQLLWDLPAMDSLRINAAVYEVPLEVLLAQNNLTEWAFVHPGDEILIQPASGEGRGISPASVRLSAVKKART